MEIERIRKKHEHEYQAFVREYEAEMETQINAYKDLEALQAATESQLEALQQKHATGLEEQGSAIEKRDGALAEVCTDAGSISGTVRLVVKRMVNHAWESARMADTLLKALDTAAPTKPTAPSTEDGDKASRSENRG